MLSAILFSFIARALGKTALIIVDTQMCFTNEQTPSTPYAACDPLVGQTCSRAGSLGVGTGATIVPIINQIRAQKSCMFDLIVRTQDYHPAGHISYASSHFPAGFSYAGGPVPFVGYPVNVHCTQASSMMIDDAQCCLVDTTQSACTALAGGCTVGPDPSTNPACSQCAANPSSCTVMPQALWTDHCLQTGDSAFATGLVTPDTDIVVQKGTNQYMDAYSAFMDNARTHYTSLHGILQANQITDVYVTGIATDFCVSWTATDAQALGYTTSVILDATAPIAVPNGDGTTSVDDAYAAWALAGVQTVNSAAVLGMSCPSPPPAMPPSLPPITRTCGCTNNLDSMNDEATQLCFKDEADRRMCRPATPTIPGIPAPPNGGCLTDYSPCMAVFDPTCAGDTAGRWASRKCARKMRRGKCHKRRVANNCCRTCAGHA